jgi:hypothetical protein
MICGVVAGGASDELPRTPGPARVPIPYFARSAARAYS